MNTERLPTCCNQYGSVDDDHDLSPVRLFAKEDLTQLVANSLCFGYIHI